MKKTVVTPSEILADAQTVMPGRVMTLKLDGDWIPSETFLQWAQSELNIDTEKSRATTLSFSKLAAASRIDGLVRNYHLLAFQKRWTNFGRKIDALREVGVSIPSVIHDLVIGPRNEFEHGYSVPTLQAARHAFEVAHLFLTATNEDHEMHSVVFANPNFTYSHASGKIGESVSFGAFNDEPMLFVDIFEEPQALKIIDPKNQEIRWAILDTFSKNEAIELARFLHRNHLQNNRSFTLTSRKFFTEIKRQAAL